MGTTTWSGVIGKTKLTVKIGQSVLKDLQHTKIVSAREQTRLRIFIAPMILAFKFSSILSTVSTSSCVKEVIKSRMLSVMMACMEMRRLVHVSMGMVVFVADDQSAETRRQAKIATATTDSFIQLFINLFIFPCQYLFTHKS